MAYIRYNDGAELCIECHVCTYCSSGFVLKEGMQSMLQLMNMILTRFVQWCAVSFNLYTTMVRIH